MQFLDFNVGLGRPAGFRGGFESSQQLLDEMRRLGIAEALVYHLLAAEGDVQFGNRLLVDELRGHANLHPCWVMAPPALGDLPEPAAWVREASAAGVRAVRLFPRHSLYTLSDWCLAPLLSEIENAKLPLLLDFGEHHWSERVVPWDHVRELCFGHQRLSVVVIGCTVGGTRDAVALLRSLPNLYLECHAFNLPDGLGLLAREGLVSKLIFGAGMPARAGECVVWQTRKSGLKPDDADAVSGGNARRLLNATSQEPRSGAEVLPMPRFHELVVDAHAHVGAWERTITSVRKPEDIVRSMDRCGIDKMIVSSFASIQGEMRPGNRQTEKILGQFPERLYGYAGVNPHYPEETAEELTYCFDNAENFVGLKFHCGLHGVPLHGSGYEPALCFANERELPVLVHGSGDDQWEEVAQRYPKASFILAHACAWDGRDPAGRETYLPFRDIENLYVDVAGSAAHRGALRALVDLVGVDKVLFGSDFPMFDLAFELGRVLLSELEPEEKKAICGGNATLLFFRGNRSQGFR